MLFITLRAVIFGLGLLCLHIDIGCRLFGSYVRKPFTTILRTLLLVVLEMIYSLPFLAIIVLPKSDITRFLNFLIFIIGILVLIHFLFPIRFGIEPGKYTFKNVKSRESNLTSSVCLHEESITIDHLNYSNQLELLILSDLHCNSKHHFKVIQESLAELKSLKFDIVLILGDLTEDQNYLRPLFMLFDEIDKRHGKFIVRGNHDYDYERLDLIEQLAKEFKITLLSNKNYYIEELNLSLLGTEYPWRKEKKMPKMAGCSIGLSHTPDNIKLFSRSGTTIVLAGHTHGGKFQIPCVGSILVPSLYGRFLDYGWFRYNKTSMFITKGFGYKPGLLGEKGEILKLLINEKNNAV